MAIDTRNFGYEFNTVDRWKEGDDFPPLPQMARSDSGPVTGQKASQRVKLNREGEGVDRDAIVRRLIGKVNSRGSK